MYALLDKRSSRINLMKTELLNMSVVIFNLLTNVQPISFQ